MKYFSGLDSTWKEIDSKISAVIDDKENSFKVIRFRSGINVSYQIIHNEDDRYLHLYDIEDGSNTVTTETWRISEEGNYGLESTRYSIESRAGKKALFTKLQSMFSNLYAKHETIRNNF
jgi:hypothetical protein